MCWVVRDAAVRDVAGDGVGVMEWLAEPAGAGVDIEAGIDARCSATSVHAAATNRMPIVASG
jgi:hypothetical protein